MVKVWDKELKRIILALVLDLIGSNTNQTQTTNSNTSQKPNNPSTYKGTKPNTNPKKDYADKLDKSGKLTTAEKEHRKQLGLCMFCGALDHKLDTCNKRKKAETKARATSMATTPSSIIEVGSASADPKK